MDSTAGQDHKGGRPRRRLTTSVLRAGAMVLSLSGPVGAGAGTLSSPGCLDGGDPRRIASVTADLDLVLDDGTALDLAGLALPRDGAWPETVHTSLADWLTGRTVLVRTLATEADRWNRMPALVFVGSSRSEPTDAAERVSVAEALLEAGLARYRPDPATAACRTVDLDLEARARTARRGLWADPQYAVLAADDGERLAATVGHMALVEGRVAGVTDGHARTYLDLTTAGRHGFTIAVPRRVAAELKADGRDPAAWRGQAVRVRGLLDDRFGLQIDLLSADQIEFTGHP